MIARNIHLADLADLAEDSAPFESPAVSRLAPPPTAALPRLRERTNDPAREYAARPGATEALPDNVAALILCKVGRAKVERHQIKISLDGQELVFTSADSATIAEHNGTGARVLWALNRRAPDFLHILGHDGSYIETIAAKGQAQWFDRGETSQAAMATAKTHLRRDMERLAHLHEPDTAEAAARAQHNAAEVARLVQIFPAATPGCDRPSGADKPKQTHVTAPGHRREPAFPKSDRIAAAMASVETQRDCAARADSIRAELPAIDDDEPEAPPVARMKPRAALGAIARQLREQAAAD